MYKLYDEKTLTKLHKVTINILDEVVRICDENDIKYFLGGGTCLGSIRHKGFIPWDDDIDILMFREDFDKFISIAPKKLGEQYTLDCFEYNKQYYLPFAKVKLNGTVFDEKMTHHLNNHKGIYIDIFPIENISNHLRLEFLKAFFVKTIIDVVFVKNKIRSIRKTNHPIIVLFFSWISRNKLMKIQKYLCTKHKNNNSKYVAVLSGYSFKKELMLREDFLPSISVKFEGKQYSIMNNYNKYLTQLYGDYMKLPPKNKRINHSPLKIVFPDDKK